MGDETTNHPTLKEVYDLIKAYHESNIAVVVTAKIQADKEHADHEARIVKLAAEIYGDEEVPGLRQEVDRLKQRQKSVTVIGHSLQAVLTAVAASVAAWIGSKQ